MSTNSRNCTSFLCRDIQLFRPGGMSSPHRIEELAYSAANRIAAAACTLSRDYLYSLANLLPRVLVDITHSWSLQRSILSESYAKVTARRLITSSRSRKAPQILCPTFLIDWLVLSRDLLNPQPWTASSSVSLFTEYQVQHKKTA
jgi:hypothetical protein